MAKCKRHDFEFQEEAYPLGCPLCLAEREDQTFNGRMFKRWLEKRRNIFQNNQMKGGKKNETTNKYTREEQRL